MDFTWKNDGCTKLAIGLGTRSEIIRLAATIKRCREYFDTSDTEEPFRA